MPGTSDAKTALRAFCPGMTKEAGSPPARGRPAGSPPRQPLGEQMHGLAVDQRAVPFAHRLEIRRAFVERLARLPAGGLQQIGGGGEHVRHAVARPG